MQRTGVSSMTFPPTAENFAELARVGIIDYELSLSYRDCERVSAAAVAALARASGVKVLSYHLPFAEPDVLDLSSESTETRRRTVALFCKLIKRGAEAGIRRFIVHPSGEPVTTDPIRRAHRIAIAKDTLASLAEVAALHGAVIAVENLPRTCLGSTVSEMEALVSGSEKLSVCFDTNHLLTDSEELFIERLGHRIRALHISDYDRINERHWMPGEGDINWHGLYRRLLSTGFDGVWLYEVLPRPKTILRERELTPSDLARNAGEIFSGHRITTFSRRIDGLGMWP